MAARLQQLVATGLQRHILAPHRAKIAKFSVPVRTEITSETGAILPHPYASKFGFLKAMLVVFPFLYTGATAGKEFAAFMEENDIFVPDDDDED